MLATSPALALVGAGSASAVESTPHAGIVYPAANQPSGRICARTSSGHLICLRGGYYPYYGTATAIIEGLGGSLPSCSHEPDSIFCTFP